MPPCLTARREAVTAAAPAPRPRPPQIINCAAVRAAIDEEEVNYRVWEEVTGRYLGWRPGWVGLATFLPPSLCGLFLPLIVQWFSKSLHHAKASSVVKTLIASKEYSN